MPYIPQYRREELDRQSTQRPQTTGELNYIITRLCLGYLERCTPSYVTLNNIIGALASVQAEFYRRVVVPYEDIKLKENGDVYE